MNPRLTRNSFLLLRPCSDGAAVAAADDVRRDDSKLRWNFVSTELDKSRTNVVVLYLVPLTTKTTSMLVM